MGCKPQPAPLACNQTISGDTTGAGATNAFGTYGRYVNAAYTCAGNLSGPEVAYSISSDEERTITVKATGLTGDLDVVVLNNDNAGTCLPGADCAARSVNTGTDDELASWTAKPPASYTVVVDSKTTGGPYQLEVSCSPSCLARTTSSTAKPTTLDCSRQWDTRRINDPDRSRQEVSDYGSCGSGYTGKEIAYQLTPISSGTYTIDLDGMTDDLDVFVIEGSSGSCDPLRCIGSSNVVGTGREEVSFNAVSLRTYWVIVDSKNPAASTSYTIRLRSSVTGCALSLSCAPEGTSNKELSCSLPSVTHSNGDLTRANNEIDGWSCDPLTTGPEVSWLFRGTAANAGQHFTVTLSDLTADLDLILVDSTSQSSCDPTLACVSNAQPGLTSESVEFDAVNGHGYYFIVDGKNGAIGNYKLTLTSPSCPVAQACRDAGSGVNFTCSSRARAYATNSTSTSTSGPTNQVTDYPGCGNTTGQIGPEVAHAFTPTVSGRYTFQLIGMSQNLNLFVVPAGAANACNPAATCLAYSTNAGTADETVSFDAVAGTRYYIVVDGPDAAASGYVLALTEGCN